ncbi:DUF3592 domain-containing protein [Streptomyces dubilierae]|uniref:DUF3592 domain-containing protein n=1 Tax=Streptomyces dubilierae TaxID=3075533 RepID=A0ABU2PK25_9ACTN|nr:hypothetical protein [Streptomyces sp. DSM 41921]MDT0392161.1 hypothetical protein [Streptomyces sp. DSM 41921]
MSLTWFTPTLPLPAFLRGPVFLVSAAAIPLALVLVPGVLLRRITHRKPPGLAIGALIVTLPAAVVLAVVTREAAEERGLAERGRWTEAVVVDVDNGQTDECALRTGDGREISPPLTDGCDPGRLEPGDRLHVLYDPRGVAGPLEDEDTAVDLDPGAYTGVIGGLAALTVAAGTWGCARLSRGDA